MFAETSVGKLRNIWRPSRCQYCNINVVLLCVSDIYCVNGCGLSVIQQQ